LRCLIEGSGKPAAVEQGLLMIRKLGTFVEFSVTSEKATVDWAIIGDTKELNIRGAHLGPDCYPVGMTSQASATREAPVRTEPYPEWG
jgi:threonine dehydrogenase-like Zn-dependent dehydrogenase